MSLLYVVRHGKSEFNLQNHAEDDQILGGQTDTPLAPDGERQSDDLGLDFARRGIVFDMAVSSRLSRSRGTLHRIIAPQAEKVRVLEPLAQLNERTLGEFEGKKLSDVHRRYPDYAHDPLKRFRASYDVRAPGGEHYGDVEERMAQAIDPLAEAAKHALIVSHKHSIRAWLRKALDLPREFALKLPIPNAHPIVLEYDGSYRLIEGLEVPKWAGRRP